MKINIQIYATKVRGELFHVMPAELRSWLVSGLAEREIVDAMTESPDMVKKALQIMVDFPALRNSIASGYNVVDLTKTFLSGSGGGYRLAGIFSGLLFSIGERGQAAAIMARFEAAAEVAVKDVSMDKSRLQMMLAAIFYASILYVLKRSPDIDDDQHLLEENPVFNYILKPHPDSDQDSLPESQKKSSGLRFLTFLRDALFYLTTPAFLKKVWIRLLIALFAWFILIGMYTTIEIVKGLVFGSHKEVPSTPEFIPQQSPSSAPSAALAPRAFELGPVMDSDSPGAVSPAATAVVQPAPAAPVAPPKAVSPDEHIVVHMGVAKADHKHTLFIFTDPHCPYCMKMEPIAEDLARHGYEITLFPTPIKGEPSEKIVAGIACAKDKVAAWEKGIGDGHVVLDGSCPTGRVAASNALDLFRAFGFNATPVLIAGDGRVHVGAMEKIDLIEWLNQSKG